MKLKTCYSELDELGPSRRKGYKSRPDELNSSLNYQGYRGGGGGGHPHPPSLSITPPTQEAVIVSNIFDLS